MIKIKLFDKQSRNVDIVLVLFFAVQLCLSTDTVYQIGAVILLLTCVILYNVFNSDKIDNIKVGCEDIRRTIFIAGCFSCLVLIAFLSKFWAYRISVNSSVLHDLCKFLVFLLCMSLYCTTYNRFVRMAKSYVVSLFIFGIVVLAVTPIWGFGDENVFGLAIHQHRNNIGASMVEGAILAFALARFEKFTWGYFLSGFMIVVTILSGSRGAVLEIIIAIGILFLLEKNARKRLINILFAVVAIGLVALLIYYVPYFHDKIWERMINLVLTVFNTSTDVADYSSYSRGLLRKRAWELFLSKPLAGIGLDGVALYNTDFPLYQGYTLRGVYSHCNFTELAADYGIIGLLIWYVPVLYMLINAWKMRKLDEHMDFCFAALAAAIVLDYARIPWTSSPTIFGYFIVMIFVYIKKNNELYVSESSLVE